jgi:hypothetical protein
MTTTVNARYYDPQTVRFITPDPLKEKHPDWTPYNYVLANPLILVDPDGRQVSYLMREGINYLKSQTDNGFLRGALSYIQTLNDAVSDLGTVAIDATRSYTRSEESLSRGDVWGVAKEAPLIASGIGLVEMGKGVAEGNPDAIGQAAGVATIIAVSAKAGGAAKSGVGLSDVTLVQKLGGELGSEFANLSKVMNEPFKPNQIDILKQAGSSKELLNSLATILKENGMTAGQVDAVLRQLKPKNVGQMPAKEKVSVRVEE